MAMATKPLVINVVFAITLTTAVAASSAGHSMSHIAFRSFPVIRRQPRSKLEKDSYTQIGPHANFLEVHTAAHVSGGMAALDLSGTVANHQDRPEIHSKLYVDCTLKAKALTSSFKGPLCPSPSLAPNSAVDCSGFCGRASMLPSDTTSYQCKNHVSVEGNGTWTCVVDESTFCVSHCR